MKLTRSRLEDIMKSKVMKKTKQLTSKNIKNLQSSRKESVPAYSFFYLILEHVTIRVNAFIMYIKHIKKIQEFII